MFLRVLLSVWVQCIIARGMVSQAENAARPDGKLNVLFLVTDDLRPELSVYGRRHVISPNFERLANRGVTFDLAYSQAPVCHPSRNSLLTGMRPDATNIASMGDLTNVPWFDSLFTIMTRNGYASAGIGKLFHGARFDDKSMFTHGRWDGNWYDYQNKEQNQLNSTVTPDDTKPESWFRDYEIATRAIDALHELELVVKKGIEKESKFENWMLSVGFKQPHTWYHLPRKYFDLYKGSEAFNELDMMDSVYPYNSPTIGYRCCARDHHMFMNDEGRARFTRAESLRDSMNISMEARRELLWGYLGGTSFLDAQMGRIFDELDRLDLWRTTIVIMTSDHGMSLGEKGMWEKNTLFEETTRVPLMIADPRYPLHHGRHYIRSPVEILNVPQTLFDLIGIDPVRSICPKSKFCHGFEGISLGPVIRDGPEVELSRNYAMSQTKVCRTVRSLDRTLTMERGKATRLWEQYCDKTNNAYSFMGYSIRTPEYRYTAWYPYFNRDRRGPGRPDLTSRPYDEELYFHRHIGEEESKNEEVGGSLTRFDISRERLNLIDSEDVQIVSAKLELREMMSTFLKHEALYGLGEVRDSYLKAIGKTRSKGEEASNTSYRDAWVNVMNNKQGRKKWRRERNTAIDIVV